MLPASDPARRKTEGARSERNAMQD